MASLQVGIRGCEEILRYASSDMHFSSGVHLDDKNKMQAELEVRIQPSPWLLFR
jgi:hypothetical protein